MDFISFGHEHGVHAIDTIEYISMRSPVSTYGRCFNIQSSRDGSKIAPKSCADVLTLPGCGEVEI